MKDDETKAPFTYAVTEMRNGRHRAECHVPGCYWWGDSTSNDAAFVVLRQHMHTHRVEVSARRARSEG